VFYGVCEQQAVQVKCKAFRSGDKSVYICQNLWGGQKKKQQLYSK